VAEAKFQAGTHYIRAERVDGKEELFIGMGDVVSLLMFLADGVAEGGELPAEIEGTVVETLHGVAEQVVRIAHQVNTLDLAEDFFAGLNPEDFN
jgi:hypothetical protein